MTSPRPVSLGFDAPVASRFRTLTMTLSAERGRRLTQSEVLAALLALAEAHPTDLRHHLPQTGATP